MSFVLGMEKLKRSKCKTLRRSVIRGNRFVLRFGFDYHAQTPWEAKEKFLQFFVEQRKRCENLVLVANSIGAFFSLSSLDETLIDKAYFISPVVDMEKLIVNMMLWANVSEQELAEKLEIPTDFGEILSWNYLCYVREHPVSWHIPTRILYGDQDNLTSLETISAFAQKIGAELTVMQGGEHWFHMEEQMQDYKNEIFWSFSRKNYQKTNWWSKTASANIGSQLTIRRMRNYVKLCCLAAAVAVSRSGCSDCPAVSRFVLQSTAGSVCKLALRRTNVAPDGNYCTRRQQLYVT